MNCVFPGSFDPITLGHINIIERAKSIFDEVTVAVLVNNNKNELFSIEDRISIVNNCCSEFKNVKVTSYNGLLVDYLKNNSTKVIIRGVRNNTDFDYELQMSQVNKQLNNEIETIFFPTLPQFSNISSSIVKEIASFNGDISNFVPESVAKKIFIEVSKRSI